MVKVYRESSCSFYTSQKYRSLLTDSFVSRSRRTCQILCYGYELIMDTSWLWYDSVIHVRTDWSWVQIQWQPSQQLDCQNRFAKLLLMGSWPVLFLSRPFPLRFSPSRLFPSLPCLRYKSGERWNVKSRQSSAVKRFTLQFESQSANSITSLYIHQYFMF